MPAQSDSHDPFPYVLGLDLGVRSLGWAVVRLENGEPVELIRTGVRCFEAGVDGDIEKGKDSSRAAARRQKRGARRQTWRRGQRLRRVFRALQKHGLLPATATTQDADRHAALAQWDDEIRERLIAEGRVSADDHLAAQLLPYSLRARALVERLEPLELGRALYHLAQRRGFLSNRKAEAQEEKDANGSKDAGNSTDSSTKQSAERDVDPESAADDIKISPRNVKKNIKQLDELRGSLTYGQYFAGLDPFERRIRQRWLGRDQVREEFRRAAIEKLPADWSL